jgi:diguanylate cyclase (GGDEF)-like protein/PAS domain S-box-containing protein
LTEASTTHKQTDIEARLRLLNAALEASANAIVITDTDAVIQWANPAFSALTGYSLDEAIGRKPGDLVKSGLQSQAFYQALWRTIKGGQVWRGEVVNKRKDGTLYTEVLTITPVRDEKGELAHFIAVKEDATARRQAEEEIRRERDFSAALLDSLPGVFYCYDEGRRFLRWNKNFTRVTGYSDAEMTERHPLDFFAGTDQALLAARIQEVFDRGYAEAEADFVTKDGARIPYYFNGLRIRLDGAPCLLGVGLDISALRRAEAERDRLFNLSIDMLCVAGFDGFFKQVNPAWLRTLGWPEAELLDRPWLEFVHPDDRAATAAVLERLARGESALAFENRYRCRDGSYRWISWNSFPLPAEGLIFAAARDITERRRAEDLLRNSEARLRALIDGLGASLFVGLLTPEGILIEANQPALEAAGLKREDVLGKPFEETYWWAYSEEVQRQLREAIRRAAGGENSRYDVRVRGAGDRFIDIDFSLRSLRNDAGQVVLLVPSASVITERKRTEEALRASEERLRLFIEHAPAALAMFDREMRYLAASRRWLTDYGLGDSGDIAGRSHYEVFPEIPDRWKAIHRRGLSGEVVRADEDRFERRDGRAQWLRWEVRPWLAASGGVGGIVIFTEDITEHKRVEEELRQASRKIQGIFAASTELAIVATALDGTIAVFNSGAERMLGYTAAEMIGLQTPEIFHLADEVEARGAELSREHGWPIHGFDVFVEEARRGCPESREWTYVRKDGVRLAVNLVITAVRDEQGAMCGFLGIASDITARKRAEQRLRQAAAVIESTREGVMVTDPDQRILMINRAFAEITGHTEAETLGKTPSLLSSGRHDRDFYAAMWASIQATGHWQGEIWNRRKNGEVYPCLLSISAVTDESGRLTGYVGVFADISRLKSSEAELEFLAYHDPLTRLPNRWLLMSRIEHAIEWARRQNQQLALLMLDLDHFKDINDSFGHLVGDDLLRQVAARLEACRRSVDTVTRLGGDEFAVLLEEIAHPEDAARVADEIVAVLNEPWQLDSLVEVRLGASVGISLFPQHGRSAIELLQHADAALYQAKAEGRGRFKYFSEDLTHAARERIDLEARLRRAIARNELRVHYQPQVDIASDRIVGAEALVRWQDPDRGLIPPGRFIPVAEVTGLIGAVGEWVLKETCAQGRRWIEAGLPPLTLAVNVSPQQFLQGDLAAVVENSLAATGFPADRLELELTESALMKRQQETVGMLGRLRAVGVRLAIDDFGTGYSSLAYLKRFPLDVLKIDKSFVDDLPDSQDDREIAATIVAIARTLRLKVLAEGVETAEQLAFLKDQGCDFYQGYLKSPPLPAEAFERLLQGQP